METSIAERAQTSLASLDPGIIAQLVIGGDLSGLNDAQKVSLYNYRCQQAGLDPAAKPFDLLKLNGKQILYANAACTQQLTAVHKLSDAITDKQMMGGIFVVSVRVTGPDGRSTENMASVAIDGMKGETLCNAMMKCCTKAKRRTVLGHCGLGMLDESETETIPGARVEQWGADGSAPAVKEQRDDSETIDAISKLAEAKSEDEITDFGKSLPVNIRTNPAFRRAATNRIKELVG